ncbi:MAG: cohesin domain-containing protein [Desulfobacterales bacterium]
MKDFFGILKTLAWILTAVTVMCGSAWGTEISIPAAEARAGQSVRIPILIDKTDNLAGVKLSLTYDKEMLTFKKADKTEHTSSLMHIVNDKNPGVLIIVMAGAKGVKGEHFPILFLEFGVSGDIAEKKTVKIEVKESQLMSDTLKDAEHKVSVHALTLFPAQSSDISGKSPSLSSETETMNAADAKSVAPDSAKQKTAADSPETAKSAEKCQGSSSKKKISTAD